MNFILLVSGAVTNEPDKLEATYSTVPHVLPHDLTGGTKTRDVNSCMLNPRFREQKRRDQPSANLPGSTVKFLNLHSLIRPYTLN